jgi:hypothetical protein
LQNSLLSPYFAGYLDTEVVQAGIDYGEAHPPSPEGEGGGGGGEG